ARPEPPLSAGKCLTAGADPMQLALLGGPPVREAPFPTPPVLTPSEQAAVAAVLELPAWSALMPDEPPETVAQLEREWAERQGGGEAVAGASGTRAVTL